MRILLVDDHAFMRDGLRAILATELDIALTDEASDGREAIEIARRAHPDVVLMDIGMPGLNGIDATREMMATPPCPRVSGCR